MPSAADPGRSRHAALAGLALVVSALVVVTSPGGAPPAEVGRQPAPAAVGRQPAPAAAPATREGPDVLPVPAPAPALTRRARPATLPGGGHRVFDPGRFLVAYYGTAGTGALGVLGETGIDAAAVRLLRAAAPFRRRGERIQPVFELIVTIADAHPGHDGDFAHDLSRVEVRRFLRGAHRHGALVVLDVQPGRTPFHHAVRRWAWALRDPWVGLALDPEWRMGRHQVPGRVVGAVTAAEVNRTSRWLARMVRRHRLPEKLLLLHQFRPDMVRHLERVRARPGLAMVQHVDGFGTPRQKVGTYQAVARPRRFTMGFKLFYDEDVRRMSAAAVRRLRPPVRFVSFQ